MAKDRQKRVWLGTYQRQQQEALEQFRQQARYSYVHDGVTHAYGKLEDLQQNQKENNLDLPIWDAVEQKNI